MPEAQVIELGAPTGLGPNGFWLCSEPPHRDLGGSKSSRGGYRVAKFCFYRICFVSAFVLFSRYLVVCGQTESRC